MAHLQLTCLGDFHVVLAGAPLTAFSTDKVRALLVYLAVESREHQRSDLAQFFWPGYSETSARNSLRQALHQLRQLLPDPAADSPWLLLTRQTVQLNPAAAIRVDVTTFTGLLAECATHAHAQLTTCQPCLARLRQAVDLYRGDFLAGFSVADSDPFEEWRRVTQEQLHIQMLDALTLLADGAEAAGDEEAALQAAQRQLVLESWQEAAHRRIMRLLAQRGQRAAALAQYQHCRQVLAEELGVEPDAETSALYEAIQSGAFRQGDTRHETRDTRHETPVSLSPVSQSPVSQSPVSQSPVSQSPVSLSLVSPSAVRDWVEMPLVDFFVERRAEVGQLTSWLMTATDGGLPVQLISILGMGGIGKTTLAAAVTKAVAPNFAVVSWRSLLNAPPLNELLRNWLQLLSRQTLTTFPDSLDEQLRLLLTYLQCERCLLVLDNVESIFVAETRDGVAQSRAGVVRPGYEGYDQLFQRLAGSEHQSCLLLTSREQPYALVRLGRQAQSTSGRIRLLPLNGLDQPAGQALLASYGLHASAAEAARLIENYSGNPLALQIVAATIVDFFGSDVATFQQEEGALFDGIRLVLDQQFARLSPLEREILIWLAIEREPVTVPTLRSNFVYPVATAPLLEALQALQNRSLLEKRDSGFTLQNVIIEYTTEYLLEQVCEEILDFRSCQDKLWILDSSADERSSEIQNLFLNRFALLKAQAKEYVRQSQARLIVQPLIERLVGQLGKAQVVAGIPHLLDTLRAAGVRAGYAGGNILNLLVHLDVDVAGYDFSHLSVWQADLRGARFVGLNLSGADLTHSAFTFAFNLNAVKLCVGRELWVAGSVAGDLCLWQASGGQLHDVLRLPSNGTHPLVFSPATVGRPRFLAGGGLDSTVWLLSVETGHYLYTLHGHSDKVWGLAFSADERLLASGSLDHTICLWEVDNGQCLHTLQGHSSGISALVFSPDGALLVSSSDGTIRVWDTHTGQVIHVLHEHPGEIYCLAVSPDGALLASGGRNGTIYLWELRSGRYLRSLLGHIHSINALLFQPHPTAHRLASASTDHTVRLWDVDAGQVVHTLVDHAFDVLWLSFSPAGDLLVSGSADQTLKLWETASGRVLDSIKGYPIVVYTVCFSPEGTLMASGGADSIVRLWGVAGSDQAAAVLDRATAPHSRVIQRLYGHTGPIYTLAFSPAVTPSPRLLACAGADHIISLHEVASGRTILTLRGHQAAVKALAFSPDGRWLASASSDRTIRLWSLPASGRLAPGLSGRVLYGHEDEVATLAFTPDGRTLVSGGMDYTLRLWAVASGQMLGVLRGHSSGVTCVAVSPDGQQIASSSFDFTLRLWDIQRGQQRQVRSGNGMGHQTVAFSPDGDLLAYAVEQVTVEIWSNHRQQVVHTLRGHTSAIKTLTFSPTAPLLVTSGWDGIICLWDLETGVCINTLHPEGPYAGMNIHGVTGISEAQQAALRALGAVEE